MHKFLLTLFFTFLLSMPFILHSQEVVSYDSDEWHRKENRQEIARIYSGEVDAAINNMKTLLADQAEKDPELLFGLSLAYSVKNDSRRSFNYFQQALENGLQISRFMTAMEGFETLHRHQPFLDAIAPYKNLPVHGPVLGALTDTSAKIWFRTWQEAEVMVKVFSDPQTRNLVTSASNTSKAADDYTTVVNVTKLKPNTTYYYRVLVNQTDADIAPSLKTLPREDEPGRFTVGFGGCSAYNPEFEHIWDTIATHPLDVFLTLGDNIYANHHTLPQVNRFCYYQRQSRPEFQRMTAEIPYIGIWDDHDFGENDSFGGPEENEPDWKVDILEVFKENFANPYFATDETPGIWFDYKIGDVQFFMLDGRYYRQPSDDGSTSMLGPVQLQWLKDELLSSTAAFKVIVSPVNWSDDSKGPMEGRIDTWEGYQREREEIFSFLTENNLSGVFLLSADRHRHDVWKHDRGEHYPLYEFTSSRLTNIHYHALMSEALFGYNEKNGFATLTFNTEAEQPHVIYDVYSIDNELIQRIRVYLHQMGVSEKG